MPVDSFARNLIQGTLAVVGTERTERRLLTEGSLVEAIKSGRARARTATAQSWAAVPGTVTAGASNSGTGFVVPPGFMFYVTAITINTDGPANFRFRFTPDNSATWYGKISNSTAANQLSGYIDVPFTFGTNGGNITANFPAGMEVAENSALTVVYSVPGSGSVTARNFSWTVTGYEVPLDLNPQASLRIAVGLDSNTANANLGNDASSMAYLGRSAWHSKLASLARGQNIDAGIWANWGQDGRTIEEFSYGLVTGQWGGNFDRLILLGGYNDAASAKYTLGSAPQQLPNAIASICDWLYQYFPTEDKRILFVGPTVSDNPDLTGSSRLTNVRAAIATAVAAQQTAGRTRIDYLDGSAAFSLAADPATDVNFKNSERVAGSRLHMSGIGSTLLGQYIFDQKKTFLFNL